MDKISVLGLVLGIVAIVGGQVLEGGHVGSLSQPTALLIVLGGTMGAVMLQSPYATFIRGVKMVRWVWYPPVVDHQQLIKQIASWSQVSRREGLLALENVMNQSKDDFARKGLQLLVDGAEPERLREVLEVEINTYEQELKLSARIWEAAGGYSPTIGILGAVLGLIHVMENLSEPSKLGAGIAVAFVATIYGVGLANLVFLPMANKLKAHIARLIVRREMIVDGLVGIANGDNQIVTGNAIGSQGAKDSIGIGQRGTSRRNLKGELRHGKTGVDQRMLDDLTKTLGCGVVPNHHRALRLAHSRGKHARQLLERAQSDADIDTAVLEIDKLTANHSSPRSKSISAQR
mgnify:CR=1 FL=1